MFTNPFILLLLVLCALHTDTYAQQVNVTEQRLMWLGLDLHLKTGSKSDWRFQHENRRFAFPDRVHQQMVRGAYEYTLGKSWKASVGLAYFVLTVPQNPSSDLRLDVPEWRPFVDLSNVQTLSSRFKVRHRYRSEQRLMHRFEGTELTEGYRYFANFRYRITLDYLAKGDGKQAGSVTLFAYDEVILQTGEGILYNIFDQNRIVGGVNLQCSKTFALDLSYINWYQQRSSGDSFYYRHIIRAMLKAYLDGQKKEAKI